jgi:hypothetical protein
VRKLTELFRRLQFGGTHGTEIIEFAVSMPLLVVLAVGIYDFGTAFTLKHKLNDAVTDGARMASHQHHPVDPAADNGCGAPNSICDIRKLVGNDLQASIGNDCGIASATGTYGGAATFTWTFTGTCGGSSLKIERAYINPNTINLPSPFDSVDPYKIENTRVTLVYPYQWQFGRAFQLLGNSSNSFGSTITVTSTKQNLD